MLGYLFRRVLGALPALLALAIALFALVASAPAPAGLSEEELARRHMGLPLLVNFDPQDRPRVVASIVSRSSVLPPEARKRDLDRLLRIGAVGLPDIVAALEKLAPADRARLSRDLAPLAFRMGLDDVADLDVPARAEGYWRRTLDEHGHDLREANVRRAIRRHLNERSEPIYARQLRNADTAILAPVIDALSAMTLSASEREELETLAIEAARRAGVSKIDGEAALGAFWAGHRAEYVEFDAAERMAARLTETRFGRWAASTVTSRFGLSWRTGEPILDDLVRRGPSTLGRAALALLCAWLLGVTFGFGAAARRDGPADRASLLGSVALASLPALVLAIVVRAAVPGSRGSEVAVVLSLTSAILPLIVRQTRAAVLEVAVQDFVRVARATGVSGPSLWLGHVGRNVAGPLLSVLAVQAPLCFGAALVVEEVLGVDGLGPATMAALRARDVPWLMALCIVSAVASMALLVAADFVHARIDPRVRRSLAEGHGTD